MFCSLESEYNISATVTARGQAHSSLPTYTLRFYLSLSSSTSPLILMWGAHWLIYPLLVGVASIWAAVLQKG